MNYALTIKEASEKYGVSVSSLYHLMKVGKLPKIQQGGQTLLSVDDLSALMYAVCPVCLERFRKENQRQRFCSQSCRQKASRSGSK